MPLLGSLLSLLETVQGHADAAHAGLAALSNLLAAALLLGLTARAYTRRTAWLA